MSEARFQSSDSARSARSLRYIREFLLPGEISLELGGSLPEVRIAYESYGELDPAASNAVLVCHAISGDSHVARHNEADDPGWWDAVVGPGGPIDTERYFVLCSNVLGGCRGTTGPGSTNPATGQPYGADFPQITVADMVDCQRHLLDALGIERLAAVVGGSLGGHQVLTWACRYPERVAVAIPLATSPRLTNQAIAFDVVGRNAILRDPDYAGGQYYDRDHKPDVGLAIARMLGHITYLSPESMRAKFEANRLQAAHVVSDFEKKFSVGSYLAHQGERFVERFDANSYLILSLAMDLFDLGADPERLRAALSVARCRWLLASFTSDWLFPPEQSRELVRALLCNAAPVSYCNVTSDCGHDAFLLDTDLDRYGELIRYSLDPDPAPAPTLSPAPDLPPDPDRGRRGSPPGDLPHWLEASRVDYDRIAEWIPAGASVLDLGCGHGELLLRLRRDGAPQRAVGVELSERAIVECVRRGVEIHADLDQGLEIFEDNAFDVVVLSHTLQAVRDVDRVVAEMLRVGRRGIVSFPNAAHAAQRRRLEEEGRAPRSSLLETHRWSDPPPLRVLSIRDFEDFCAERDIAIEALLALDVAGGGRIPLDPHREADLAIFFIRRGGG